MQLLVHGNIGDRDIQSDACLKQATMDHVMHPAGGVLCMHTLDGGIPIYLWASRASQLNGGLGGLGQLVFIATLLIALLLHFNAKAKHISQALALDALTHWVATLASWQEHVCNKNISGHWQKHERSSLARCSAFLAAFSFLSKAS